MFNLPRENCEEFHEVYKDVVPHYIVSFVIYVLKLLFRIAFMCWTGEMGTHDIHS